jgi:hypothetical protein
MKKNLIALLVVLALVTVGLFAANPGPASFDVKTSVTGINLMKITDAKFTGVSASDFIDAGEFEGPVQVSASGAQTFDAWISTLSNSRAGYKVTMSATPMTSQIGQNIATIHYAVTANSKTVDTDTSPSAQVIIDTLSGMSVVASESHEITLTVDSTSFDAAVEGEYSGTVTFTWTTS